MRGKFVNVLAVTLLLSLLILSSTISISETARRGAAPSTFWSGTSAPAGAPKGDMSHDNAARPALDLRAGTLPPNPANCTQGKRTVLLNPIRGDMQSILLQNYTTLGEAGGGTLKLGPGIFEINETLNLQKYSNVSIQGSGIGRTVLSLPPSPVQFFTADNGTPVGVYNTSLGGPVNGTTVNFLQVSGGTPINNFELCDLTINAQANNASEDWSGSLVMDISGGQHHVYSDISEVGFFGPSTTPNGIHLESSGSGHSPGVGYVLDELVASHNTVPYENYPGFKGGPNFLNVGAVVNCTLANVAGSGLVAFEVAPPQGCTMENWNISGHVLIDPSDGGTWGGSLFQNVSVLADGTPAPNALGISVANGSSVGGSNFTALRWNDCYFDGTAVDVANMIDVENSTFDGGVNFTSAIFNHNVVIWDPNSSQSPISLPIRVEGSPTGGSSSVLRDDTFLFPNGTGSKDPLLLLVPHDTWSNVTIEIVGATPGYVMRAPELAIAAYSSFSRVTYDSLGNGSPPALILVDIVGSPGFQDLGIVVGALTRVYNDLPILVPTAPESLRGTSDGPTRITLWWNASSGPVTNYTVYAGTNRSNLAERFSTGGALDFTATGLSPKTTYFFAVQAWNFSLHSDVTPTIGVTTMPLPNYVPGVPNGLAVTSRGSSEIGIRWDPSTGTVTNYTVYAGTNASRPTLHASTHGATNFTVSGLVANTTYFLAAQAWNDSFHSNLSSPIQAVTLALPNPVPGVPSGVTVAIRNSSAIGIRWSPSTGVVTNYTVYAGTNASDPTVHLSTGGATNLTVTGLRPDTAYSFSVEAWNATWASGRSAPVNTSTLPLTVPPATGPTVAIDWVLATETIAGTLLAIVGPLALLGVLRARARVRAARRLSRGARAGRPKTASPRVLNE